MRRQKKKIYLLKASRILIASVSIKVPQRWRLTDGEFFEFYLQNKDVKIERKKTVKLHLECPQELKQEAEIHKLLWNWSSVTGFILKPKWFSEILAFKSLIIKLINQENQANHFNLGISLMLWFRIQKKSKSTCSSF
ncbi:MAG: hypothetical protein NW226_26815 [Microscillaceae bacterium]|nr:hypothetical protein [Microscillaceae bacterium]